ncbi:MAG: hypothetical protein U0R44_01545 [Candidatus Micrarchaeia archaeon]
MRSAARKGEPKQETESAETVSYFDLNQLELAFINRALNGSMEKPPGIVDIAAKERILRIQKGNLEKLCKKRGKECRPLALEHELKKILSGAKIFSLFGK